MSVSSLLIPLSNGPCRMDFGAKINLPEKRASIKIEDESRYIECWHKFNFIHQFITFSCKQLYCAQIHIMLFVPYSLPIRWESTTLPQIQTQQKKKNRFLLLGNHKKYGLRMAAIRRWLSAVQPTSKKDSVARNCESLNLREDDIKNCDSHMRRYIRTIHVSGSHRKPHKKYIFSHLISMCWWTSKQR